MRNNISIIIIVSLACVFAAGCDGTSGMKNFTLQNAVLQLTGHNDANPTQNAADVFDENDPDTRRVAIEKLSKQSWALRDPYLKRFAMLTDPRIEPDPTVRSVAVRTLGKAGNKKYDDELLRALADPDKTVRWDACAVYAKSPCEKATASLQQLAISDKSRDVRQTAADALRYYKTNDVKRTLIGCLEDDDFCVRNAAHKSLITITGVDLGEDPQKWTDENIGRSQKDGTHAPKEKSNSKPWWDWMGVTD